MPWNTKQGHRFWGKSRELKWIAVVHLRGLQYWIFPPFFKFYQNLTFYNFEFYNDEPIIFYMHIELTIHEIFWPTCSPLRIDTSLKVPIYIHNYMYFVWINTDPSFQVYPTWMLSRSFSVINPLTPRSD